LIHSQTRYVGGLPLILVEILCPHPIDMTPSESTGNGEGPWSLYQLD
jgi:hypothetical protein